MFKYYFNIYKILNEENIDVTTYKNDCYESNPKFNIAHNIVTSNFVSLEMQLQKFINLSRNIKDDIFFIQLKRKTNYISVNCKCLSVSLFLCYFINNPRETNIHPFER